MKLIRLTQKFNSKCINLFLSQITGFIEYEEGTEVYVTGGNFFKVKETEKEIIDRIIGDGKRKATGLGYIEF